MKILNRVLSPYFALKNKYTKISKYNIVVSFITHGSHIYTDPPVGYNRPGAKSIQILPRKMNNRYETSVFRTDGFSEIRIWNIAFKNIINSTLSSANPLVLHGRVNIKIYDIQCATLDVEDKKQDKKSNTIRKLIAGLTVDELTPLYVIPEEPPGQHCEILGWPTAKPLRVLLAAKILRRSIVIEYSKSNA